MPITLITIDQEEAMKAAANLAALQANFGSTKATVDALETSLVAVAAESDTTAAGLTATNAALDATNANVASVQAGLVAIQTTVDALAARFNALHLINPCDPQFVGGAKCDVTEVQDGVMAAGSNTLASGAARFKASDVGKPIAVLGAGPAVSILKTTIAEFLDTSHVNLAAAATLAVNGVAVQWGTDDTAAIQAALDFAATLRGPIAPAGTGNKLVMNMGGAVLLPGTAYYAAGAQGQHARTALIGFGPQVSRLVLPPLTDQNVWQNYGASASNHDDFITVTGVGFEGNRTFQSSSAVNGHGMLLWNASSQFPEQTCSSMFTNISIRECIGSGMRCVATQGEIHLTTLRITACNKYGLYWNAFDTHGANLSVGACGFSAVVLGVGAASFRIVGLKAWFSGTGGANQLDQSNIQVAASYTSLVDVESQESKGHGFTISGTGNIFSNCRSDDTGDVSSYSTPPVFPTFRSAWNIDAGKDNLFKGCSAGLQVKANNNYATSALRLLNGADQNRGDIWTQARTRIPSDHGGSATAAQQWNAGGPYQKWVNANPGTPPAILNNVLIVDGDAVT